MANPRIDELRKRLEKEPGSRLFAQLAEELRKEGELAEAVRLCREGLQKHPNYPSARMTLGRALFDQGELAGARDELGAVLKGAPDNILASRLLAEALEGLGDLEGARAQFRKTLALAPGDKVAVARLQGLEGKAPDVPVSAIPGPAAAPKAAPPAAGAPPAPPPSRSMPPTRAAPPSGPAPAAAVVAAALARAAAAKSQPPKAPAPPPAPAAAKAPEAAPIPLVGAGEGFELEGAHEAAAVAFREDEAGTVALTAKELADAASSAREEPPPIALVAAEEEFELERPYEAAPVALVPAEPAHSPPVPTPPAAGEPEAPIPLVAAEEEFELERPYEAAPVGFKDEVSGTTQPLDRSQLKIPAEEPVRLEGTTVPSAEEVLDFDEAPTISESPAFKPEESAPHPAEPEIEPDEPRPETISFAGREAGHETAEEEPSFDASPPAAEALPPEAGPAGADGEPVAAKGDEGVSEEIASATLAELYYGQGFPEKALEVYRTLLARDPGHERARTRIAEIEALEQRVEIEARPEPPLAAASVPTDSRAARRAAIERTIARLETMLTTIRKE